MYVVKKRRATDLEAPYPTECFTFLWPEKFFNRSLRQSNNVNQSFRKSNTTQKQLFFGISQIWIVFPSNKPAPKCETFGRVVVGGSVGSWIISVTMRQNPSPSYFFQEARKTFSASSFFLSFFVSFFILSLFLFFFLSFFLPVSMSSCVIYDTEDTSPTKHFTISEAGNPPTAGFYAFKIRWPKDSKALKWQNIRSGKSFPLFLPLPDVVPFDGKRLDGKKNEERE